MNKTCTIISISLSVACFAYMFNNNIYDSCLFGLFAFILSIIGFSLEKRAPYFWNTKFNKVLYFLSRGDKEYNIDCKEYIYTRLSNTEYKFEKIINIYPNCNDLDRIPERFAWSAPSNSAVIEPIISGHEITAVRQQELWTYYSVYFHQTCKKHTSFKTGSVIHNLVDEHGQAVPFLSVTVDHKTKLLVMRVCFEIEKPPEHAVFKIYSAKNPSKEIYSENLEFDHVIKGFSRTVDFPRQNGKYTIIW